MRLRNAAIIIGLLGVPLATSAYAAQVTDSVRDLAVIQDGRGAARLLFREGAAIDALPDVTIWKATLSVPVTGTAKEETVRLRLHPVTAAWNAAGTDWNAGWSRAGGDYDEELFATAEVSYRSGTATAVFDVTAILKETLEHGMFADGFLLTVDPKDGVGLPAADLTRFGTLAGASLDVKYRPAFRSAQAR